MPPKILPPIKGNCPSGYTLIPGKNICCPDGYEYKEVGKKCCCPEGCVRLQKIDYDGCSALPPLRWMFDKDNPSGGKGTEFGNKPYKDGACDIHDECYQQRTTSRKYCDKQMLKAMLRACSNATPKKPPCVFAAGGYYLALRVFGRLAWIKNVLTKPRRYYCLCKKEGSSSKSGKSQGRLGDKSEAKKDSHGCPSCTHSVKGPAIQGSPNVFVNSLPALRVDDMGIHVACCGPNTWIAKKGSDTVFINGKPAHRKKDKTKHCGGEGKLIEGSSNVFVGDGGG